ncbi:MAG TPA: hypothetical protein VIP57_08875 [Candidatus Dormibacteraeota bacterium]|jgi:hypothetical protein
MKQTLVALGVLGLMAGVSCGGASAQPAGSTIVLREADAGKTFNVHGGDTIRVILIDKYPVPGSSLVWTVLASPDSVLKAGAWSRSAQVRDSGPGRTDTYTADFTAAAAGQAKLDAKGATSCEAMAKTGCPDQALSFTVMVGR